MSKLAKERILKERGITLTRPSRNRSRKVLPRITTTNHRQKTVLMKYLEEKYGVRMEDILLSGSLAVVANRLGNEVDVTTISKWIKRFKLRYSKDNLPDCQGCLHYGKACDAGICYVLLDLGLYELIPNKKEEILGEGN